MRITTSAILRNYKSNLSRSMANLDKSRTHVMTQRSFNSVAENPGAAARASQLQRKYYKNLDHIDMVSDIQSRQDCQEDALMQISKSATTISKEYSIEALNGTNSHDERLTYASAIKEYQKSMVLSLNASYEDTFVFAGTDGKSAPFELNETTGVLTFRGADVNAAPGSADYALLQKYASENLYVDLGFGLSMDNTNNVVPSSAFDISLPGINAVGYGVDADGMSNNAILLAGQLAKELESPNFNMDNYKKLMTKFQGATDKITDNVTQLGVKTEFLTNTVDRLKSTDISLQQQMQKVEGIDMAQAITEYMWDQYAYNSALKVGNSILSPSFIDFMS